MSRDIILWWVIGFFVGLFVGFAIEKASAENYTYVVNGTELEDEWITETCIKLQINSPECDMVYGNIIDGPSDGRLK